MLRKIILQITLVISIILFVAALTGKAYCTSSACLDASVVFSTGWFGAFVEIGSLGNWLTEMLSKHTNSLDPNSGAAIMWLANPLLFISWIGILRWPRGSFIFSVCALIMSLLFLFFSHVLHNDIGHYSKIVSYESGYWLWVGSMAVMVAGNTALKFFSYKHVYIETGSSPFIPED
jgi:hypothetical protein